MTTAGLRTRHKAPTYHMRFLTFLTLPVGWGMQEEIIQHTNKQTGGEGVTTQTVQDLDALMSTACIPSL